MIPLELHNWHMWLKAESRAIHSMIAETQKEDVVRRCFLDGYRAHHKWTCKYFATQVRAHRRLVVGRN